MVSVFMSEAWAWVPSECVAKNYPLNPEGDGQTGPLWTGVAVQPVLFL